MERRRRLVRIALVLDALVCGVWAYWAATAMLRQLSGTGSGGIAGVSSGVLEMLYTVVPPIVTMVLARAAGSRQANYWRNAHLAVLLALIVLPMMGGLRVMMVSIVVLLPVQLFFVIGALAIWFDKTDNPPLPPSTSPEASS
jgi:hypothetical protein